MKSVKIAYIGVLSALAIIFGYIESLFPIPIAIPGIKLGISNIVILFTLIKLDRKDAFFIMLIKVFVTSLLFSGFNTFIYSLLGGIFSILSMSIAFRFKFSNIGASMVGGVFHNIGQIVAATIILGSISTLYYFPILLLSGLIVGFLIGIVTNLVLSKLQLS